MAMATALANLNLTAHVVSKRNQRRPSMSHRPMMVTMCYKKPYWASVHEDIESHLKQAIVAKEPVDVYEPMRHLVFSVPVNMAPALCIAGCELVGGRREQATAAAAALHVIYAASFVHENLRLSDRPSLMPKPKSKPVMYHAFSSNIELLVGDGMIPFGLELLANSDNPDRDISGRILRVISEITRAIGSAGMVYAQYNELQRSESKGKGVKCEEMKNHTYEKKEGELQACGRLGSKKEVEELKTLAVEQIKGRFNEAKVEEISTYFESNLSRV
ncbi:Geranylgeranyl pyrophosphate synthase [Melia azedarach]|uniref:Geranylgeranyl pyrophosphate synthase n=1 Tax=Melia azedarach TaxID=155640 RepID=A0ACC1YN38_MELAZ|nr:Geranylgeranyl pyrophosphate synthase [Melia azedarach]